MSFDAKLLETVLVCPKSKVALVQEGDSLISTDPTCRLRYAIADGIPNMLVEEATQLSAEEWSAIMQRQGRDWTTGAKLGGGAT